MDYASARTLECIYRNYATRGEGLVRSGLREEATPGAQVWGKHQYE